MKARNIHTVDLKSYPSIYKNTTCFFKISEIDIYFQLDFPTTASTTDYARVKMGQDLTAATVCFWMKSDDSSNQGTPFSYATEEGDNILTLTDYDGYITVFLIRVGVLTALHPRPGKSKVAICFLRNSGRNPTRSNWNPKGYQLLSMWVCMARF